MVPWTPSRIPSPWGIGPSGSTINRLRLAPVQTLSTVTTSYGTAPSLLKLEGLPWSDPSGQHRLSYTLSKQGQADPSAVLSTLCPGLDAALFVVLVLLLLLLFICKMMSLE